MKNLLFFFLFVSTFSFSQKIQERNDFKKYFDEYNHKGCFVLYDLKKNLYIKYNPKVCNKRFIPASTFKIFNSLVGLETGIVKDENEVFKWDGENRSVESWNQDLDMTKAFRFSAVWFYQELARKIGQKNMQHYININKYGNQDISGGIDRFWLDGGLKISADEQIELLKKIYNSKIKFSQRNIDILKKIMIYEQNENYILRAKTGWAVRIKDQVGWFVGYVERAEDVYFFALNIQTKEPEEGFVSRKEITFKILKDLGVL